MDSVLHSIVAMPSLLLRVLAPSFENVPTDKLIMKFATAAAALFYDEGRWNLKSSLCRETFWGSGSIFPLRIPTRNSHEVPYVFSEPLLVRCVALFLSLLS